MATKKTMSEGTRKILAFLKEAGVGTPFTAKEVAKKLGFEKTNQVTGSVTALVNKELVARTVGTVTDAEGNSKEVKQFYITEAGMAFNPDTDLNPAEDED